MKKLALILLAVATLAGTASVASAQWYGGGYYSGGYPYYRDRYRERYYDDDRYYRRRHHRHWRGYGYGYNPCGPGWSVQDGVCKPYRGY